MKTESSSTAMTDLKPGDRCVYFVTAPDPAKPRVPHPLPCFIEKIYDTDRVRIRMQTPRGSAVYKQVPKRFVEPYGVGM
jgi:hypothetical protein